MLTTLRAAGLGRQDAVRALRALTAFSAGALLCETGIAPGLHGPDAAGHRASGSGQPTSR